MDKKTVPNRIKRFAKFVYLKIFRMNDTPMRIALGFGLGVFVGVMPGIGPVAALVLAFIFRVNRAGALLGSIIFNTWVGLIMLLPVIKVGSAVMGLNYLDVYNGWTACLKSFSLLKLSKLSIHDVVIPIGVGYFVISVISGVIAFVIAYFVSLEIRNRKRRNNNK